MLLHTSISCGTPSVLHRRESVVWTVTVMCATYVDIQFVAVAHAMCAGEEADGLDECLVPSGTTTQVWYGVRQRGPAQTQLAHRSRHCARCVKERQPV